MKVSSSSSADKDIEKAQSDSPRREHNNDGNGNNQDPSHNHNHNNDNDMGSEGSRNVSNTVSDAGSHSGYGQQPEHKHHQLDPSSSSSPPLLPTHRADENAQELPPALLHGSLLNNPIFRTLRRLEDALDRKLGVESQGIARKLPHDRDPSYAKWSNQMVMFALWASGTMNLSCFATGFLGHEFGLDLRRSILVVAFGTLTGSAVTGWCATMGAPTGLRQISISRYSVGWWPSKLVAVLNAVEQVGWSSVGCITGGLALQALSDNKIGSELGVVIISVIGFVCSFIGLKAVFTYEKFAWMVFFVIFIVMYGQTARFGDLKTPASVTGEDLSGAALTLFGVVYGSSASWATVASDYYVEYAVDTSKVKVFLLTTAGICEFPILP